MSGAEQSVGDHYARIRQRLAALATQLPEADLGTPVPTCPGWRVRDVLAHLVAVAEDAVAGRLQGVPDETMTAEQVARHRDDSISDLVRQWDAIAPAFEAAMSEMRMWPAAFYALTHECDVAHALGRPGPREDPFVAVMATKLAARLAGRAEVVFDGVPCPKTPAADVQLRVAPYEFIRVAMGRRSAEQIAALDWNGDATAVLPHVCVFGPSTEAIVE